MSGAEAGAVAGEGGGGREGQGQRKDVQALLAPGRELIRRVQRISPMGTSSNHPTGPGNHKSNMPGLKGQFLRIRGRSKSRWRRIMKCGKLCSMLCG